MDREEQLYRGYVYWTLHPEWALSSELVYDNYKTEKSAFLPNVETLRTLLSVRYFHPSGFFGLLTGTFTSQDINRQGNAEIEGKRIEGNSDFFLLDAAIGYRLPRRFGLLSIEALNLMDNRFKYQDDSSREFKIDPVVTRFIPERTVIGRMTINL